MKQIKLNKGIALVDDADYDRVSKYSWYVNNGYAMTAITVSPGKQKHVYMHRFILGIEERIDHKNGNKLDNQRQNLRPATQSQNKANSKLHCDSTSGYKGVTWDKQYGKWKAYISFNKKSVFIGRYADPIEAAKAYDKKAKELHGEFACLNFK